jgi:hypothetical protein
MGGVVACTKRQKTQRKREEGAHFEDVGTNERKILK